MNEKPWYQDGWIVLVVLVVAAIFGPSLYRAFQQNQMGGFSSQLRGEIRRPMFDQPEFVFSIWHQNPGDIKNGRVKVTAESPLLLDSNKSRTETRSFEVWSPNQDNELAFRFPLSRFDGQTRIRFRVDFNSKNVAAHDFQMSWLGEGWEKDQKPSK